MSRPAALASLRGACSWAPEPTRLRAPTAASRPQDDRALETLRPMLLQSLNAIAAGLRATGRGLVRRHPALAADPLW